MSQFIKGVSVESTFPRETNFGLAHWMAEVPREAAKAAGGLGSEVVHDLRVALRRCRTMADGFRAIDPDKNWKKMRSEAKALFDSLGRLRDSQVKTEWAEKTLERVDPAVAHRVLARLREQEPQLRQQAADALESFDHKQWRNWTRLLPKRTARVPAGSDAFLALALEKLVAARRLHARAIKTGSATAFHRLRIALKKFRYVVENFLPQQHENWKDGLKEAQDILGEIHDLDVLKDSLGSACSGEPPEVRYQWEQVLEQERAVRVERYGACMSGENSRWRVWRKGLPRGQGARSASLTRLQTWSSFLDGDLRHGRRVARFAVQICEGLSRLGLANAVDQGSRELLRAAAIVHEVGRAHRGKDHHKKTERMVGQLDHLAGWRRRDIMTMARVARYHRGALPSSPKLAGVPAMERRKVKLLAGVLRLANALDGEHDGSIQRIVLTKNDGFVVIRAQGLRQDSALAEKVAGARHLLEVTCGVPILVRPWPTTKRRASNTSS